MSQIIEHCAGIDVGKRFLLCCVLNGEAAAEPSSETVRFDTNGQRPNPSSRLVEEETGHACGDGKHRVVLDPDLQYSGRSLGGEPGQP